MRIFLLWRRPSNAAEFLDTHCVAARLQKLFAPLFGVPLQMSMLETPAACLVFLQLPVREWKPAFLEDDGSVTAAAAEYPLNARSVLATRQTPVADQGTLVALARQLQAEPEQLLRELSPPFSLIWSARQGGELFVQNDGLGQAQLFELDQGPLWALSNKITAFRALGLVLKPDPEQWAVRLTVGWFPLDMSGYHGIRFLAPGTQLRLTSRGIQRRQWDVVSDWVHPKPMPRAECLELARTSLLRQLEAVMPLWGQPAADLSGGWDTRAVVAVLRASGSKFSAQVVGLPDRPDVVIARQLAEIAGFPLTVNSAAELPPADPGACGHCIARALLWQAGYFEDRKHKAFLADEEFLDGGVVKIMGQHGEMGRGKWAHKIGAAKLSEDQFEAALLEKLLLHVPPFLRLSLHNVVRDVLLQMYRQARIYGVTGLAQLDFFHLFEKTRRWASGKLNVHTGVVVAPFVQPDFIRATFGYQLRKDEKTLYSPHFHRHIIARHAPEWEKVPFDRQLERQTAGQTPTTTDQGQPRSWRQQTGHLPYDSIGYWHTVGMPILREGLARDGFWTEVFNPDRARELWSTAPDQLALLFFLPGVCQDM
jgi:hypothetical protein